MAPKASKIELQCAIGFDGRVVGGLALHPDGQHLLYPLGSTIVVKNLNTGKQFFLRGHSDKVTCVAISNNGKYVASGQRTHMGFKADLILWDFEKAKQDSRQAMVFKFPELHHVKIQALAFSPNDTYLASVGGADCNKLVLWHVETGKALTSTPAATESALCVSFYRNDETKLVTGGQYHVRTWDFDTKLNGLNPTDVVLGTLRRIVKCITLSADDRSLYAGTSTGDLLHISLDSRIPAFKQGSNELFSQGVICAHWFQGRKGSYVLAGNGDGSVVIINTNKLKREPVKCKVTGGVTSLALIRGDSSQTPTGFYCGTTESNIYTCPKLASMDESVQLVSSCHYEGVNDVAFLAGFESVFVTCSKNDVRVWNAAEQRELLRIQVPNLICTRVCLPKDGKVILTGWNDGKIRALKPVSGEVAYIINDAHPKGVTAIAVTDDCKTIISGGAAGQVRFWSAPNRKMIISLKEHKSSVSAIKIRPDGKECVSASDDGSCIIWDIARGSRLQAMFAPTMFKDVLYHPDESQLLTCGSDRKLTYWDAYDGTAIRIVEGSRYEINALDIDPEGVKFVTGGNDCLVKVYDYDDGEVSAVGEGHSGGISAVKFSPDLKTIVSVGAEGGIFVWKYDATLKDESGEVDYEGKQEAKGGD